MYIWNEQGLSENKAIKIKLNQSSAQLWTSLLLNLTLRSKSQKPFDIECALTIPLFNKLLSKKNLIDHSFFVKTERGKSR